ncbi:hypothetical protein ABB37_05131 [Leptomonas pyrrhocoris]|uniref:Uncharacterized protein n=1 Tax=Leptomonas pyrrhocoris TaxID=157538 RepID=A0A0N0DVC2_LEPPY|nr:hypothetical protein ABB37_05131 [Leptomonas pyrrhocoris]KPA80142.1 hypothetical protein ABB37_05131 [Leptomonas pyrrhocoris]|eukprot:XP_015658581.1 hypothetical protein ABB37_05131 [Leptomonas pyrrhocoris]
MQQRRDNYSGMADEVEVLQTKVDRAIELGLQPPDTDEISQLLTLRLTLDNTNEQLKMLDYRWQTYLDKQYVQSQHLDEFLESLVQVLLKKKPERPLEELLIYLESEKK